MDANILPTQPEGGALILDAIATVQAITKPPRTFGELADQIFVTVIKIGVYHQCSRVDFVIDSYPDVSIKDIEHSVQASDGATVITILGAEQKVPTVKKVPEAWTKQSIPTPIPFPKLVHA